MSYFLLSFLPPVSLLDHFLTSFHIELFVRCHAGFSVVLHFDSSSSSSENENADLLGPVSTVSVVVEKELFRVIDLVGAMTFGVLSETVWRSAVIEVLLPSLFGIADLLLGTSTEGFSGAM